MKIYRTDFNARLVFAVLWTILGIAYMMTWLLDQAWHYFGGF